MSLDPIVPEDEMALAEKLPLVVGAGRGQRSLPNAWRSASRL
jgi:hypothetical protein